MQRSGTIGLVPPRYGDDVIGGAEAVISELAHGLAARGWNIEILTTCARDHFTWANEYPAGVSTDGAVTVRRFPAEITTPRAERAMLSAAIHRGDPVDIGMQQRWMNDDLRSSRLFHHILDHADEYRALVFAPYLFWPTFACGQIASERTILMPCLHDEPEAGLEIFQPLFEGAAGIWFLSDPERDLARRLFRLPAQHEVVGAPVHPTPPLVGTDAVRERLGITDRYVLFAGRREGAKNWPWLLDAYARVVEREPLPLKLVTMGTGEVDPPVEIADQVVDLGFVSDDDHPHVFAGADAYIQPSPYESFSRSIMEAWQVGTPVIANADSEVVAWHCERSGGGLVYRDVYEFEQALRFVAAQPEAAAAMAARAAEYVASNYAPDAVLDRVEATIEAWLPMEA
ncbi:MAG: glycosyltransferase [Acidimicrobiia bacterium]|nr:glycosyltransferase [Acidimicrobiia bacterium]